MPLLAQQLLTLKTAGAPTHLTYSTSEAPHTSALDALMSVKAATSRLPGATMYAHPSPRSATACVQMGLGLDVIGSKVR